MFLSNLLRWNFKTFRLNIFDFTLSLILKITTTGISYHFIMLVRRVKDMEGLITGLRIKPILLMDLVKNSL